MSIWSWFGFGGLGNKDTGPQYSGPPSKHTESGTTVTDERAMQVSSVWACTGLISETTATLPLKVYQPHTRWARGNTGPFPV